MLSTRSIAVASVLLAVAGRTLAFPYAVPSTLLRARSTTPTLPDENGSCEYISPWAQLCPTGESNRHVEWHMPEGADGLALSTNFFSP